MAWALVCGCLLGAQAESDPFSILSISGNGTLSWSNSVRDAVEYRVESSSLDASEVWTQDQAALLPTGAVMSTTVPLSPGPRFYRVQAVTGTAQSDANYLVIDLSGGAANTNYPLTYLADVPSGGWTDEYKTTKLVLRRIAADTFIMGSPPGEVGHDDDEPQHTVTLTRPFYIGIFEVTQKQWELIKGDWPSYFRNPTYRNARAVELVSFNAIRGTGAGTNWPANNSVDTNSFMGRLRERTGLAFDLPTEAQWECAGRAVTTNALNSGQDLIDDEVDMNLLTLGRYWYNGGSGNTPNGDTSVATAKAGSYQPNAWGLYDIHGNVWEWCLDWYEADPDVTEDPRGPPSGAARVIRGGAWGLAAAYCRVASRFYFYPGSAFYAVGFRVYLPADP